MDEAYVGLSLMREEPATLDLSYSPLIFVSSTHFNAEDIHEFEDDLAACGARLTYDINEAEIILSRVVQKKRAQFDLREKGLFTKEVRNENKRNENKTGSGEVYRTRCAAGEKRKYEQIESADGHAATVVVIDDSSTASDEEVGSRRRAGGPLREYSRHIQGDTDHASRSPTSHQDSGKLIKVVKTEWFTDSKKFGSAQRLEDYIVYQGISVERTVAAETWASTASAVRGSSLLKLNTSPRRTTLSKRFRSVTGSDILQRAQEDASLSTHKVHDRFGRRKFGASAPFVNPSSWEAGHATEPQYAQLLEQTTTENEGESSSDLPEPPEWVKRGVKYACQRLTPKSNPNDPFVDQLKKIRLARLLTNDEIGVRAYSTSIASLAAYTYKISHPREILALPGCDKKIANLFAEWSNSGRIKAVDDLEDDENLKILETFYNIWGVGNTTARQFYYDKGWRDLDDVVEYGWKELSRVQQIGVKYYDEFLDLIPRAEVEQIGKVIHQHAVKIRDSGIQTMLVGGYRRGKEFNGDVDIVVTHPDEAATLNLVEDIVNSLEEEDWITHTLTLSLKSSERDQQTLPFRAGGGGHGFDTLDKALVVWHDHTWSSKEQDLAENPKAKNPNIHRRVDIIVSPWRTVGCAAIGWSGGTTFQRDLRRYAKKVKTWKFDSSGVRDRRNGEVVDIEGYYEWKGQSSPGCRARTIEEAERRVFEGFGLAYREPWERCTG